MIIEAAKKLSGTRKNIQFILCGDGPHKSRLQEQGIGLSNVHFLGVQSDERFVQLLNTADIHLIPQRAEAADLVLPSKLGGIFASGRPVITMAAPNTGLADEVVNSGIVVAPGDADALAGAVQTLADDVDLRHRLGESARRRAVERWGKTSILKLLVRDLAALGDHK